MLDITVSFRGMPFFFVCLMGISS
ncbi:hypothetical protein EIZ39_25970 [Ammoniphilus sp. CFH 90114]|nr:hypothetical protein EIZ39_25970 [Ammoniphilus sp. CFH 90114]